MLGEPAERPLTAPEALTDAREALLLDHVPPEDPSPRLILEPTQTAVAPDMASGREFTVSRLVTKQPVPRV